MSNILLDYLVAKYGLRYGTIMYRRIMAGA